MEFDLLVIGGHVFDGRGGAPFAADVAVNGDRIAAIGRLYGATAAQVIDASGLAVSPGFIDTHTHSDLTCFLGSMHPDLVAASVRQGVTTEVCGNCGFSAFPVGSSDDRNLQRHIGALLGETPIEWKDLAGYADAVRAAGLRSNVAPLLGLGSLRASVMGFSDRPPTRDEMRTMSMLADEAFEQGAVGVSTGLIYSPGLFASTDEIIEITKSIARFGRPYTSHVRGESDPVLEAIGEAISIGREAGVPIHVSHHKALGRANWGRTHETLELIDKVRSEGTDVTMDAYPYTSGSTVLFALLPPWAQEGGIPATLERLSDRSVRERIKKDLSTPPFAFENLVAMGGWEAIDLAYCPGAPELEGRRISELAADAGKDDADFVFDRLIEQDGRGTMILHILNEGDVQRVLGHEATMIGSDGIPLPGKPHPRWAGSFGRVLGHYCREVRLLNLAGAIHKMSGMAAARFGLSRRGTLEEGNFADIVVFDTETVIDRSTFVEPLTPPVGVRAVVVNGIVVVADSALTEARPGRVLLAD